MSEKYEIISFNKKIFYRERIEKEWREIERGKQGERGRE